MGARSAAGIETKHYAPASPRPDDRKARKEDLTLAAPELLKGSKRLREADYEVITSGRWFLIPQSSAKQDG
jgi:hypothetical protein